MFAFFVGNHLQYSEKCLTHFDNADMELGGWETERRLTFPTLRFSLTEVFTSFILRLRASFSTSKLGRIGLIFKRMILSTSRCELDSSKPDRIGLNKEYTECRAFSPVVRIGSPPPHPQASVVPPPPAHLVPKGEHTRLRERGRGEPVRTKEQTLWYSRYSIIPLRG